MVKYLIFVGLVLLTFIAGPYLLLGVPATATGRGVALVSASSAGTAIAALAIGALGLLYKPNRFAGFIIGTFIGVGLMFAGANAQTNCTYNGINVRLCDVPNGWQSSTPRAHASAEFRRSDGFSAQLIIDAAGSDQGLTLPAAADAVVRNMRESVNTGNFELLVRGTNSGLRDSEVIVYRATLHGIPFVFANTVYVGRNETIQNVTWRINNELAVEDRAAHLDFARGLVLMPNF